MNYGNEYIISGIPYLNETENNLRELFEQNLEFVDDQLPIENKYQLFKYQHYLQSLVSYIFNPSIVLRFGFMDKEMLNNISKDIRKEAEMEAVNMCRNLLYRTRFVLPGLNDMCDRLKQTYICAYERHLYDLINLKNCVLPNWCNFELFYYFPKEKIENIVNRCFNYSMCGISSSIISEKAEDESYFAFNSTFPECASSEALSSEQSYSVLSDKYVILTAIGSALFLIAILGYICNTFRKRKNKNRPTFV